jgi:Bacterial Ig domain
MKYFKFTNRSRQSRVALVASVLISAIFLTSACTSPPPPPPPPPPTNQLPVIDSLSSDKTEVPTSSEVQIVAQASDPDGDTLTYQWSTTGGIFSGEGSTIIWTAPAVSDNYTVTVTVSDDKGGTASKSMTIAAIYMPNHPPVVTGMTIDGAPPTNENPARQWVTKTIHCIASDPDGDQLSYMWRASGGKITGEGSTVGWTSPGINGEYTVTVIVSDGRDGRAEGSIVFKVLCCGRG